GEMSNVLPSGVRASLESRSRETGGLLLSFSGRPVAASSTGVSGMFEKICPSGETTSELGMKFLFCQSVFPLARSQQNVPTSFNAKVEIRFLPSGVKRSRSLQAFVPRNLLKVSWPVSRFHTFPRRSLPTCPPPATDFPSGENTTGQIMCAPLMASLRIILPVCVSQTSSSPLATLSVMSRRPSGESAVSPQPLPP